MASDEITITTPEDIATLNLPAGFFVLNAKVQLSQASDAGTTEVRCVLRVEDAAGVKPTVFDVAQVALSGDHIALPLATAADLMSGGIGGLAALNCAGPSVTASNVTLVAVQVGTLVTLP